MDTVYLELLPTIGIDSEGLPEPLKEVGLPVTIQRLVKGEVVETATSIRIQPHADPKRDQPGRIVPDTRIVATSEPRVVQALLESGQYLLTDPPGQKATSGTADHRASRRKRSAHRIEE